MVACIVVVDQMLLMCQRVLESMLECLGSNDPSAVPLSAKSPLLHLSTYCARLPINTKLHVAPPRTVEPA